MAVKYREKIINLETGEETWRDFTDAETAEVEEAQAQNKAKAIAQADTEAKRLAVLQKLGLSEEEAKLLLG